MVFRADTLAGAADAMQVAAADEATPLHGLLADVRHAADLLQELLQQTQ
ncbi:MAG TPA: hypothetical protein VK928_00830 [Longimicrobiales bacterium]|nr:hypothetical protein [Longimicrobiales bacterium]